MKNSVAIVYLGIVLVALLLFALFDNNTKTQDLKAVEQTRISRINMVNAECREDLRLCAAALNSGQGAEIPVKSLKTFINYADKNITFGNDASAMWKAVLESALAEGLSSAATDRVKLKKEEVEKKAAVFTALKAFLDKAIDNGYNFEF